MLSGWLAILLEDFIVLSQLCGAPVLYKKIFQVLFKRKDRSVFDEPISRHQLRRSIASEEALDLYGVFGDIADCANGTGGVAQRSSQYLSGYDCGDSVHWRMVSTVAMSPAEEKEGRT